jgi:magnesium-transporting ATPase (P-type)
MQVATFTVNYQGHPFRESLYENRPLFKSLSIVFGIGVFAAAEISRDFNNWFQLMPFPLSVRFFLLKLFSFNSYIVVVSCNSRCRHYPRFGSGLWLGVSDALFICKC